MRRLLVPIAAVASLIASPSRGADATDKPKVGHFPHIDFDVEKKQVRVECEMLAVNAPLEFFCCVKGTNDYESMIRAEIRPSHLHTALLAVGLEPGEPITYSEATKKFLPPRGPPLHLTMEYQKDGKTESVPAYRWMRDVKTKKGPPAFTWVFCGSRTMPDGKYAADATGYLVTVVNFDYAVIDVPELASSSNDLLEWERNPDITPKAGTKVWMVIEPAGKDVKPKAPRAENHDSTAPARTPTTQLSSTDGGVDAEISAAQAKTKALRDQWETKVGPQREAFKKAAEAHYQIISDLRRQQQKLIDEADRVQRTIDELEKEYQDLTTPRPQSGQ